MSWNKVVLVTGCSDGGIGSSVCSAFANHGCTVYATARSLSSLSTLTDPSIHKLALDVADPAAAKAAVEQVINEQGRIDILVNNAGAAGVGPLLDFDVDAAKGVFDVNVFGVLGLTQLAAKEMAKKGKGLVINVGSVVGNVPTPWTGVYGASKAALHSLTEVLRMELAPLGISVMLVAPGAITSGFGNKAITSYNPVQGSYYAAMKYWIEKRATQSQTDRFSLPSAVFAERLVKRALRPSPPTFFTAGGKSFVFFLLERVPRKLVWFVLSRMWGTAAMQNPAKEEAKNK